MQGLFITCIMSDIEMNVLKFVVMDQLNIYERSYKVI